MSGALNRVVTEWPRVRKDAPAVPFIIHGPGKKSNNRAAKQRGSIKMQRILILPLCLSKSCVVPDEEKSRPADIITISQTMR